MKVPSTPYFPGSQNCPVALTVALVLCGCPAGGAGASEPTLNTRVQQKHCRLRCLVHRASLSVAASVQQVPSVRPNCSRCHDSKEGRRVLWERAPPW